MNLEDLTPNTFSSGSRNWLSPTPNPGPNPSTDRNEEIARKLVNLIDSNPHNQLKEYVLANHEVLSRLIKSFNDLQEDLRILHDISLDAEKNKEIGKKDIEAIDSVLEEVDLELDDYKEEVDMLKGRIKNTIENLRSVLPLLGLKEIDETHLDSLTPKPDMFNSRKEFLEAYRKFKPSSSSSSILTMEELEKLIKNKEYK